MRGIFHVERAAEIPPPSPLCVRSRRNRGLQEIPPLVRPGAGGALGRGDGNEGRHHAAREGSRQSAAGHERERAASQREGWREGPPTRVRWD
ncbi:hypothetical protein FQN60_018547 [Etheostoma spectabile]|uniref:Uncharacterized protein n=1 Tax=Etheostoma spectabile TaxID=54343 RepID=A0A5J5DIC1_9PERO|nr:hypothetical protein FQN60_018547 [Etheostoma spectabile]